MNDQANKKKMAEAFDIDSVDKDLKASNQGVWFPIGGGRVLVAEWMNDEHDAFVREIGKKYGRRIKAKAMSPEEIAQVFAPQWQFVIRGLENFTQRGQPVVWSPELITEWALDPKKAAFFDTIQALAKEEMNYRVETVQELGEKLPTQQSGAGVGEG